MATTRERERFFTGRQVTTMVVALMAAVVMLPGVVWAVDSFTNVAVMDPVSGVKAKVDSSRRLVVGDGTSALTVDGTVVARDAAPAEFKTYLKTDVKGSGSCAVLAAAPPSGRAIVLSTFQVDVFQNPSPGPGDHLYLSRGTTCAGPVLTVVTPPGLGHTTVPLDPGAVTTTGFSIKTNGDLAADVTGSGYLAPSTGITTSSLDAESSERPPER